MRVIAQRNKRVGYRVAVRRSAKRAPKYVNPSTTLDPTVDSGAVVIDTDTGEVQQVLETGQVVVEQ